MTERLGWLESPNAPEYHELDENYDCPKCREHWRTSGQIGHYVYSHIGSLAGERLEPVHGVVRRIKSIDREKGIVEFGEVEKP